MRLLGKKIPNGRQALVLDSRLRENDGVSSYLEVALSWLISEEPYQTFSLSRASRSELPGQRSGNTIWG